MIKKTQIVNKSSGIALVEVLVAAAVLSVGILGLAQLQVLSLKNIQGDADRTSAVEFASGIINCMRSNRVIAISGYYDKKVGDNNNYIDCNKMPTASICLLTQQRTPMEVKDFDLNEWVQDLDRNLNFGKGTIETSEIDSDPRTVLDPGKPAIPTKIVPRSLVKITVRWESRTEFKDEAKTKPKEIEFVLRTRL